MINKWGVYCKEKYKKLITGASTLRTFSSRLFHFSFLFFFFFPSFVRPRVYNSFLFPIGYIVLEDLTASYHRPSILDIKLGIRQHGLRDSHKKILSKTMKCATTTSSSLGLRVCGMQTFLPSSSNYVYRDKYYGRSLTPRSFYELLREFFSPAHTPLSSASLTLVSSF